MKELYNLNMMMIPCKKNNLTRFGGTFGTLNFDKKSFFHTLLGFSSFWNHEPTNAIHSDGDGVYTSDKCLYLSPVNEFSFKM